MAESTVRILFLGDTAQATRQISKLETSFGSLGRAAKIATGALAIGLVGGLAAATKGALSFQESMDKIRGLVGESEKAVKSYSKAILAMRGLPQGPKELADALFFVTSAGIHGAKAIDVLKVSAKAAAAGLGETKTVADAVTSAVNAYSKEGLKAGKATDVLVATVREGKVAADSLAGSLGRVISPAHAVGAQFDEVGAAIASMTRVGLSAQESTTALRGLLLGLAAPTTKAAAAMKELGTSGADMQKRIQQDGLLSALTFLADRIHGNIQAGKELIPNVRALNGFLAITGANSKETAKIFDDLAHSAGSTNRAFEAAAKGGTFKLHSALADLQKAAIPIGNLLIPVVVKAAQKLADLAGFIDKIVQASGTEAKFHIALVGLENVKAQLFGATKLVEGGPTGTIKVHTEGLAQRLSKSFSDAVDQVDWGVVGKRVEDGFVKAFRFTADAADKLVNSLTDAINRNAGKIADIGAVILVTIFTKLLDPTFWASHWQLALAVAVTAASLMTGGLGKLGLVLAERLGATFGPAVGRLLVAALNKIPEEIGVPLLNIVEKAGSVLTSGFAKEIGKLAGLIGRGLVALFEKLPGIIQLAFKVGFVLAFIAAVQRLFDIMGSGFAAVLGGLRNAFGAFWKWLEDRALNAALAVVEPFTHLPFALGGWARRAKDAINAELDQIHPAKVKLEVSGGKFTETITGRGGKEVIHGDLLRGLAHARGGRIGGAPVAADNVPALLSPGEFVVTGGGERMLESMTFPGVLNWLQGAQPSHFAAGGRAAQVASEIGADTGMFASRSLKSLATSKGTLQQVVGDIVAGISGLMGGGTSGANQALGKRMAAALGWTGGNWQALRSLWQGESGWNQFAKNASSGAYGIPQSLPASKMASAGADYLTNPATQIRWGLGYIRSRYGSPSAAYGAWQSRSPHWYSGGGRVQLFAAGGRVRKPPKRGGHRPRALGVLTAVAAPGQPGLENLGQIIAHIARLEDDKSFLSQEYGNVSSRFDNLDYGQSFVNDDGTVNQPFVDQRISELNQLMAERDKLRQKMIEQREEYAKGIAMLVKALAALQRRLAAATKKIAAETEEINRLNDLIYAEEKKKPTKVTKTTGTGKNKKTTHTTVGGPDQDKIRVWRHRIGALSHERTSQRSLMNTIKGQISGDNTELTGWRHDYRFLPLDIAGVENDMGTLGNDLRDLGSAPAIFKKFGGGTAGSAAGGPDTTTPSAVVDDAALQAALAEIGKLKLALGIQGVQLPIIGAFQKGTIQIPETGLALVHAGESITPAGVARGGDGGSIGDVHVHPVFIVEDGAVNVDKIKMVAVSVSDEIGRKIGLSANDRLRSGRF